ncbi:ABC transporter ATP-binding protein [Sporolactobacillus terrae]|uniref:Peptide ABC transporter ATP-binding protein n=1 Tax=Sporolactobacillus terrae TaxID=269673 RepID=A0ABX5Q4S3_9BACL|nr:ABC transporter ATP-binding protein [Sporolactobacillus terrae]QAA21637.1 peptide ABC transporter ATP-binding protein [Sporolactobacillus terrae]QAA24609.1 peptide ABC transporter ATP-binding protein [Sporolactobacillus terrae]UAK16446.1 ABC transporter ATP-binding protein [Sporolactobacillus terrae]
MLEVNHLKAYIDSSNGLVKAVDDVSFSIKRGETIGIVGESGSGKSVLAQSLMQLNPSPPVFYPQGEILFEGKDLLKKSTKELCALRGNELAMIFQDPLSSLNPIFKVGRQLIEAIQSHKKIAHKQAEAQALQLLRDVGIHQPQQCMKSYPHELSGGMRQRIVIAMALSGEPKLLIADEPTTALDVTIQAQILGLLKQIQLKYKTAIIIITHDLGIVAKLADRILVMYSGKIVEEGTAEDIFYQTAMPYTWSLLRAIPSLKLTRHDRLMSIPGQPPNLVSPPAGCNFSPRCPFATPQCMETEPELTAVGAHHKKACLLTAQAFEESKHRFEQKQPEEV